MDSISGEVKYECLLFDMDDTLYPSSSGINLACRKNIQDYMLHHLRIEESQVPRMCLDLYKEYGTTMAGLKALGFEFDNDEFHAYVHGKLPYGILKPDPFLRGLLLSMPQRKIIFTNADKAHAAEVLKRLGLEDCFEGVICFETLNPPVLPSDSDEKIDINRSDEFEDHILIQAKQSKGESDTDSSKSESDTGSSKADGSKAGSPRILCKPSIEAIKTAIQIANIDPQKTIFFDDSARNIAAGKAAGLTTVIVGSSELVSGADHALNSIHNIKEALPEIWKGWDPLEPVLPSTAVETVVLA